MRRFIRVYLILVTMASFYSNLNGQTTRTVKIGTDTIRLTRLNVITTEISSQRRLMAAHSSQNYSVIGVEGGVKVINLETGDEKTCVGSSSEKYERLALDNEGSVIGAYKDGEITIWSRQNCEILIRIKSTVRQNIYLSPNGKFLFYSRKSVRAGRDVLWDIESNQLKADLDFEKIVRQTSETLSLNSSTKTLTTADFSPNSSILALGYYDYLILWDISKERVSKVLLDRDVDGGRLSHRGIYRIKFSPDGTLVTSSGADGKVKIWDVKSGKLLKSLDVKSKVWGRTSISTNNKFLATAGIDEGVTLWDISSLKTLWKTKSRNRIPNFSDSSVSLVSTETGDIYDVRTGEKVPDLKGEFLENGFFLMDEIDGAVSYCKLERLIT